ncbi:hypothetical protein IWW50_001921 [Coemansia erecta]|nr:hypothetical protein GGF43_001553 [Coemansia sp. RSA 2618]KAJ2827375.1 hypothetical protein IWW50_001921 [Coemansia erecta]
MPQIQVNPFPRLETLICTGIFPFNSALVFHGGRTRFRHLDIELDSTIMHALLLTSVLDKGTFWGLNYVRLGWVHGDRRGYTLEYAQKLVKAAIELCPNTRILKTFVRMGYDAFEDVCAAEFPRYLEHLDIKYVMLDIDQLVLLLGRLKHLRSLVTGFNCCLECPENGVASNRHIRELQQRLQGTVVGVWAVSINASGYRHFAKAAESAVLLADILPNVTRMSLLSTSHNLTNELQIIDGIRQRPVYLNNERLAQVEFSILCVWTNEPLQRGWGLNN